MYVVHVCIFMCIHMCAYVYTYMYLYKCIFCVMCACVCICSNVCIYVCTPVMYVYVAFLLYKVPNSGFDTSAVDLISSVNLFFMLGMYKIYTNEC